MAVVQRAQIQAHSGWAPCAAGQLEQNLLRSLLTAPASPLPRAEIGARRVTQLAETEKVFMPRTV